MLSELVILNHDIHGDPISGTVEKGKWTRNRGAKARGTNLTEVSAPKKVASCLHWYLEGKLWSDVSWHLFSKGLSGNAEHMQNEFLLWCKLPMSVHKC